MSGIQSEIESWLAARPWVRHAIELSILVLIVIDFVRVGARLIGLDSPLVWDEAVYAIRARGWVDQDAPLTGWSYIRPPVLPLVNSLAVLAGGDESALRVSGLVAGVGLLLAVWWIARSMVDALAGLAVVAILHGSPTLQWHSALALTDVPSAALLAVAVGLIWHELELRTRPGPGLALAAAAMGLAFLTRYGTVAAIVPILVVAVGLWWRKLLTYPRWPLVALGIGLVVATGHFAWSTVQTGTPFGVLQAAQGVVPEWLGQEAQLVFQHWLNLELAGTVGKVAILASLVAVPAAAAISVVAPSWRRFMRGMILVSTAGISQLVLLVGGTAHLEQRYFIFAIAMTVLAGTCLVARATMRMPFLIRVALLAALGVVVLLNRETAVDFSFQRTERVARTYEPSRIMGEVLREERSASECTVLGPGGPMVSWYSACDVIPLRGSALGDTASASDRWVSVFSSPDEVAGDGQPLADAIRLADGPPLEIVDPESGDCRYPLAFASLTPRRGRALCQTVCVRS